MITKGIILSIDNNGNTCTVRIPLFETAADPSKVIVNATMITMPGMFGGYNINDVVYLGFENNSVDEPIILGKLFLGNAKEATSKGGGINCQSLMLNGNSLAAVLANMTATTQASVYAQQIINSSNPEYYTKDEVDKKIADAIEAFKNTLK